MFPATLSRPVVYRILTIPGDGDVVVMYMNSWDGRDGGGDTTAAMGRIFLITARTTTTMAGTTMAMGVMATIMAVITTPGVLIAMFE